MLNISSLSTLKGSEEWNPDSTVWGNEIPTEKAWFGPYISHRGWCRNPCDVSEPDSFHSASVSIMLFLFQWPLKPVGHYWHWGGVEDPPRLPSLTELKALMWPGITATESFLENTHIQALTGSDAKSPTHYTHSSVSAEREPRHRASSTCHASCSPQTCRCRDGHEVWNTNDTLYLMY